MKNGLVKILLGGGSAGVGLGLIWILGRLVEARPDLAWQYIEKSSMFLLTAGVLAMLWMGGGKVITAMQSSATALQGLSDAVGKIGEQGENRAETTDAAIRYVAQNTEKILERIAVLESRA